MHSDETHRDFAPTGQWRSRRGRDETHAFIVRVHLSIKGGERHPQFSVEDVNVGGTSRFATYALAAESLGNRIQEIISGPVGDRGQS